MKSKRLNKLIIIVVLFFLFSCVKKEEKREVGSNLKFVDPTIGNVGFLLQPTRPTVQLPNQMVRMAPDRKDYLDYRIYRFPLNIISHRIAKAFNIKPVTGGLTDDSWKDGLLYDHDLEINRPWYYSTYFLDDDIKVEYTVGEKTGIFRFTYPENAQKHVLLNHYYENGEYVLSDSNVVRGIEHFKNVTIYMYGQFSGKPTMGLSNEGKVWATYDEGDNGAVEFRYATSFVSSEQARKNFEEELSANMTFDALKSKGEAIWDKTINQIQVEGGTEAQKRSFYTALYRCYERMINITEDGHYFSGFDNQIHSSTRPFYVDDWVWDTYLAHHPLRVILHPGMEADMVQSYVDMYKQSGWLPTFPVIYGDHECMNGFHSTIMILDAYRKGIREFEADTAFQGMLKNAESATMLPWRNGKKCVLDDFYYEKGFYPALRPDQKETVELVHGFEKRQSVAITLGHSYDDWALAEMARDLGKQDVLAKYQRRALNYKNLWNPEQQMFLPKDEKGEWILIDPKFDGGMGARDYYDENNGWTYLWQVQHDIEGLVGLMGGKDKFEQKLDQLFKEGLGRSKYEFWAKLPDATGLVGQFSMGNEPSFHIPYLYNYTNSPWKAQMWTRFLLDVWFKDNIFGIPGDEDGGGMSAFVVFTSMGFYPITPGVPMYTITSPVFEKVTIKLENGNEFKLIAKNCSKKNKYIQLAKFNGKPLDKPWFSHEDLVKGGTLELELGQYPNKKWGY